MKWLINNKKAEENQDGFAAIVVAMVLIMVLGLMSVGFVQLMRSNQKAALNKQLSDQAYYAAETGVNDAAEAYAAGYTTAKKTCGLSAPLSGSSPNSPGYYLTQPTINNTTGVSITCLLTNPDPSNVLIPASDNQPTVVEVQGCSQTNNSSPLSQCSGNSGETIGTISLKWSDTSGNAPPVPAAQTCTNNLYPRAQTSSTDTVWSYQNMLRVEVIPVSSASLTRQDLVNNEYTAFLCPDNKATSVTDTYPITGNTGLSGGDLLDSNCVSSGSGSGDTCTVNLNVSGMNNTSGYSTYFLVLRALYPTDISTSVTLSGVGVTPAALNIGDAQLEVDSTGQAHNVLKRIQVRIPEANIYYMPEADIHGEICKQLEVYPNTLQTPNNSVDASPCGNGSSSIRSQLQQSGP